MDPRPRVLVSASGVGFYGNPGDAGPGRGLAPAATATGRHRATLGGVDERRRRTRGVRVVTMRTGVVLSAKGGAFGRRLLPIFRLGLGGRLGSGRQWWSWVSLRDYVRACASCSTATTSPGR